MVERTSGVGGGGFGGFGFGASGGNGSGPGWNGNFQNLLTFKDVSDKTRAHLFRVYTSLAMSTATCAMGMYVNQNFVMNGFMMIIGAIML